MKASGIGGQALMEGVMMKNGNKYACAVRKPDGEIIVDVQETHAIADKCKVFKWPIIRGAITFVDSMIIGVKTLTWSASFFEEDEAELKKKKEAEKKAREKGATDEQLAAKAKRQEGLFLFGTVAISIVLAVGIFMILPYFLSMLLKKVITSPALLALCEGLIRILLFVGYVAAISCMKDIRRVFMYHGAEHKSINCVEQGFELTVNNVRKCSREHKRCGTSFLLIVMVISVVFFVFIRADAVWLMVLIRLLLIPVIAGISYEFIRLAGTSDNKVVAFLSKPGLALQNFTTREPDDSMIECAIASVEAVFDWRKYQEEAKQEKKDAELAKESSLERRRRERSEETKKNYDEAKNDVAMNPEDEDFDLDAAIAAAVEKRKAARMAEYEKAQREAAGIAEEAEEKPSGNEEAKEKPEDKKEALTKDSVETDTTEDKKAEEKKAEDKKASVKQDKNNKGADELKEKNDIKTKEETTVEPSNDRKNEKNSSNGQGKTSHKKNDRKNDSKKFESKKNGAVNKSEEPADKASEKPEDKAAGKSEEKTGKSPEKAAEKQEKKEDSVKKDKGFNSGRYVPGNSKPAAAKKEEPEDDGEFSGSEKMNGYFKRPERNDTPKKGSEMSGLYTNTNRNNVYVQTLDSISTPDDEPEDDEVLNALDRFFVGRKKEADSVPAKNDKKDIKPENAGKADGKANENGKGNDRNSSGKSKKNKKK